MAMSNELARAAVVFGLGFLGLLTGSGSSPAQFPATCIPPSLVCPTTEPPRAIVPSSRADFFEDPPTPVVALKVRVPASAAASQEIEYRLCVENNSAAAAHHVLVRNPLPANARFVRANPEPSAQSPELIWRLGTLEPGTRREIVLVLAPTGADDIKSCARVQFEHGQCVCTKINRAALSLEKTGPSRALLNETLSYKLTLTNLGAAELVNVQLTDILPPGLEHASGKNRLSWLIGSLAPGQSRAVEYRVIAKATGRLCNKAIATAEGGFRKEFESCVTVGEARLELNMTGPKVRYLNIPATYQITVSNPGTDALPNVVVRNPLPAQTAFVRAGDGGQLDGEEVHWSVGMLAAGASQTFEIVLRALATGRICNRATATAGSGLTRQTEFCTDFTGASALSLEVGDVDDPIEIGSTTAYTITVRNQGMTPATRVRIQATLPPELALQQATGPANSRNDGQRILYEPLTLPAGAEARYRVDVKAQRAGDVRFKVELTADQLSAGPVQQEESTTIYAALPLARRKPMKADRAIMPGTNPQ